MAYFNQDHILGPLAIMPMSWAPTVCRLACQGLYRVIKYMFIGHLLCVKVFIDQSSVLSPYCAPGTTISPLQFNSKPHLLSTNYVWAEHHNSSLKTKSYLLCSTYCVPGIVLRTWSDNSHSPHILSTYCALDTVLGALLKNCPHILSTYYVLGTIY